jgi:hypothetical protein
MMATEDEEILSVEQFFGRLRSKKDLRRVRVSRRAGIGRFSLFQLLKGNSNCYVETLQKLAQSFGGEVLIRVPRGTKAPPDAETL